MKGIVILKAVCYVLIGAGTAMGTSLAQWANSGQWPDKINWVSMIIGATVGGATQLLAFFSRSFSNYLDERTERNFKTAAITKMPPEEHQT
jgi:hypothetical protein